MSKIVVYYETPSTFKNFIGLKDKIVNFIYKRLDFFLKGKVEINPFSNLNQYNLEEEDLIIAVNLNNPMIDEKLLFKMIETARERSKMVKSLGGVPGSTPLFVSTVGAYKKRSEEAIVFTDLQNEYNTQINLARGKRKVLFEKFIKNHEHFYKWRIKDLLNYCSTKEGVEFVLSYTSQKKMKYFNDCPYCNSKNLRALFNSGGSPATGFLTKYSSYYFHCTDCNLVYLNPTLPDDQLWHYYDSSSYEVPLNITSYADYFKKINRNNSGCFYNYKAVINDIQTLDKNANVLDIGGGLGDFLIYLRNYFPKFNLELYDYRIESNLIKELKRKKIRARSCNFLETDLLKESYDLITNWEVIEHIPVLRLESYIKSISRALKKNGLFCLSTPDFDSYYTRALDFWSCFPGEHLSVLSRSFLEPIFKKYDLIIEREYHETVTLDFSDSWFLYGAESNCTEESRAQSKIINDFLNCTEAKNLFKDYLRKNNLGSELILSLRKIS